MPIKGGMKKGYRCSNDLAEGFQGVKKSTVLLSLCFTHETVKSLFL